MKKRIFFIRLMYLNNLLNELYNKLRKVFKINMQILIKKKIRIYSNTYIIIYK